MAKQIKGKIPQLGFVGIGPMGGKMARFLIKDGYPVLIHDIDKAKLDAISKEGGQIASSNAEVVRKSDIVLTSLPLSEVWVKVAENDFLPNARPGQVFIDMGTVTPPETRRLYAEFKKKGASLIDSPVSNAGGGNNKFYVFIGGDKEVVDENWPIYETLGVPDHTVYCGPSGSGQVVKGINQLGIGLISAAAVEIVAFGVRCGVDPDAFGKAVGVEGEKGFRGMIYDLAKAAKSGKIETTSVKQGQLDHYLKEAHSRNFELPLTRALFEFLKDSPLTIKDANRMSPSYWNELLKFKL